jgi:fatty-acyl-CoA synthase
VVLKAQRLLATGAVERIGRGLYRRPELLELLFACARIGAIFVPFNTRMPAAELRVFLAVTRPRLVVAEDGFRDVALASAGEDRHDRVVTFAGAARREGFAGGVERVRADPGPDLAAPVLILFTSGTTGRPKGATFTQENMTFNALNVITAFGLTAADEILTAVPMRGRFRRRGARAGRRRPPAPAPPRCTAPRTPARATAGHRTAHACA